MHKHIVLQKAEDAYSLELSNLSVSICGHYRNLPNHAVKRDGIAEYVVLYCVGGKGYLVTDGRRQVVKNGDFIFLNQQLPHEYGSDIDDPWSIVWMHLTGELKNLNEYFQKQANHFLWHVGFHVSIYDLFLKLIHCAEQQINPLQALKLEHYARLIFCELMTLETAVKESSYIYKIKEYLIAHRSENLSLDTLAQIFSVSKYHMVRTFKQATGYTPIEFLSRQKIDFACELLRDTNDSIYSVSQQLGYKTQYYFSEQFKSITGYAPSMFRQLVQKEFF